MRHNKNFNHLGRQAGHRKSMLSNMACSLILHKRINTTVAKAKALRQYVEPILTKSKTDSTHARRVVFGDLKQKQAVTELFRNIAPKIMDRPGGYTRILKTGFRQGDGAEMCFIELVDFNTVYTSDKKASEAKPKTRRGRSGAKSEGSAAPKAEKAPAKEAAPAVEEAKVEEVAVEAAPEAEAPAVEETPAAEVAEDKVSE